VIPTPVRLLRSFLPNGSGACPAGVPHADPGATRLYQDALRWDLPEFIAWALIYQAEQGELASVPLARAMAGEVTNPALQARAAALDGPPS
jgi:hypothetical protein